MAIANGGQSFGMYSSFRLNYSGLVNNPGSLPVPLCTNALLNLPGSIFKKFCISIACVYAHSRRNRSLRGCTLAPRDGTHRLIAWSALTFRVKRGPSNRPRVAKPLALHYSIEVLLIFGPRKNSHPFLSCDQDRRCQRTRIETNRSRRNGRYGRNL